MEWLTFGLSALCAIGSYVGFLLAQREKKEAKKSEAAAKEYAENANKANLEIQRYTHHLNVEVDKQQELDNEKEKVKHCIIELNKDKQNVSFGINQVFQTLYKSNGDKKALLNILKSLAEEGFICDDDFIGDSEDFESFSVNRDY